MTLGADFFDYGGHSLVAIRIIGKLVSVHGIEISFNNSFRSPSAVALAACAMIRGCNSGQRMSQTLQGAEQVPLTLVQDCLQRTYAAYRFSTIFNLLFALDFYDIVDENLFFKAFSDLLARAADKPPI